MKCLFLLAMSPSYILYKSLRQAEEARIIGLIMGFLDMKKNQPCLL